MAAAKPRRTGAPSLPPLTDTTLSTFLAEASARAPGADTHAVLGNEAADLDSVACAIVWSHVCSEARPAAAHMLPFVNVRRAELALRRDVLRALDLAGVSVDALAFRDTADLSACGSLTLVDHNALSPADAPLGPRVRAVLDHHADDGLYAAADPRVVEPVGSCATLVAERAAAAGAALSAGAARLLLGAVLLDCHDMDARVGKATPRDVAAAESLCACAGLDGAQRRALFETLKAARKDISGFSAYDLMRKDAKIVRGTSFSVAVCSVGVSPAELVDRAAADAGLAASERRFAAEWGVEHAVLMAGFSDGAGAFVRKIVVPRGAGAAESRRLDAFVKDLTSAGEAIGVELDDAQTDGFTTLNQTNVKASRKQVLPIIRAVLQR